MKKAILVIAVLVIALVGLTSYNGNETKEKGKGTLIAELKGGGNTVVGGGKKQD